VVSIEVIHVGPGKKMRRGKKNPKWKVNKAKGSTKGMKPSQAGRKKRIP